MKTAPMTVVETPYYLKKVAGLLDDADREDLTRRSRYSC
jgi:hypothetical protein